MAIIVEDGTGKSDSQSYISVIELKAYWETRGTTLTQADAVLETWLIQSAIYIDYNYSFYGSIMDEDQALQFPRTTFYDCRGREVAEGTIPQQLKDAQAQLAYSSQGKDLSTTISTGLKAKSVGSVHIEYAGDSSQAKKVYQAANQLMKCISMTSGSFITRC